jgi:hypothetical protein
VNDLVLEQCAARCTAWIKNLSPMHAAGSSMTPGHLFGYRLHW